MTTALAPLEALPLPQRASAHPVDVYCASVAAGSRPMIRAGLRTLARMLSGDASASEYSVPWHLVRYEHAAALRQELASRYAHSTANRMLCALRGVLKACWRLKLMSAEDYYATRSIESVQGERLPAGRALSAGELAALVDGCAAHRGTGHMQEAIGRRDAALVALLYGCGLRRAEVVALSLRDYTAETGELRVLGKRNKQRTAWIMDSGVAAALGDWLALYVPWLAHHGDEDDIKDAPLLCHIVKGGRLTGARLSQDAVNKIMARRAEGASVAHLTPHDFRRTFVSDLLDRGADVETVRRLAGHANVNTTARYDRRPEEAKKRAASLLHLPYRGVDG